MIDQDHLVAQGSRNPVGRLLRGSVVPSLVAVGLLTLISWLVSSDAAKSVLVGGGMAVIALAAGPALHQLCRNLDPSLVVGIVVLAYCLVVGLVGIGFAQVNDASWLVGEYAAGGVLAGAVAWVVGHMRASMRLRQPLWDEDRSTAGR